MSAAITITIRADIQRGAGKAEHVIGRVVRAGADESAEVVRNTVVAALREMNDELKELIQ
jgi:hypothetical protein